MSAVFWLCDTNGARKGEVIEHPDPLSNEGSGTVGTRYRSKSKVSSIACSWLEKGGSLAALQQMLGHASIVTTQRYAKLTDAAVRAEAGRMGEVWGKMATPDGIDPEDGELLKLYPRAN